MSERVALLTYDAQSDQRLATGESIRIHHIRSAMCAPLWSSDNIIGVMQVDSPFHAGTFNEGEDPLECARRELAEETGLLAARYTSLGVVHGAAMLTGRAHMFLAEAITESDRSPETYEQDMELLRLPFVEALEAALNGHIAHSGSVTALCRAARALKVI